VDGLGPLVVAMGFFDCDHPCSRSDRFSGNPSGPFPEMSLK